MAKTKKAKKTKKISKGNSLMVVAPEPGYVNVPLGLNELEALVTLLESSVEAYELMAKRTAALGDSTTSGVLASRAQLCDLFMRHFNSHLIMEEPDSRLKH
jgi:hypothetical protein